MSEKKPVPLLGRLAVQLKMITPDQLGQALANATGARKLPDVLIEAGLINPTQLAKLENAQRNVIAKHRAKQGGSSGAQTQPAPAAPIPAQDPAVHAAAAHTAEVAAPVTADVVADLHKAQTNVTETLDLGDPMPAVASEPAVPSTPLAPPTPAASQVPVPPAAPAPPVATAVSDHGAVPSLQLPLPEPSEADRQNLEQILGQAIQAGASDVHLHSRGPMKFRINGELAVQGGGEPMDQGATERMIAASLTPSERGELSYMGELDYCLDVDGVGRFRANAYRQQRGFDVVMRAVSAKPPTLEELGLPADLAKYVDYHQGMVLITGPAGCGKSATLAALVNLINEQREEHILSIEDPIEIVHPSKKCLVNQRHAGRHTASFARALRGALREDPDVIVIGELRDLETISLAMTAAETGHFVLATLHTNNAVRTINRIIGAFPSNEQGQVRAMLSVSLRAVISQRLVPTADGSGRVPALELLVINKAIGNLIRDEKTVQVRSSIQTGRAQGMYLLEQSLNDLVEAGKITREVALANAEEEKLITAGR